MWFGVPPTYQNDETLNANTVVKYNDLQLCDEIHFDNLPLYRKAPSFNAWDESYLGGRKAGQLSKHFLYKFKF